MSGSRTRARAIVEGWAPPVWRPKAIEDKVWLKRYQGLKLCPWVPGRGRECVCEEEVKAHCPLIGNSE